MLMLITYDISFDDPNGQARLRRIAKHCLDYGVRAQYSVFECDVTPDQWVMLKNKLLETYDPTYGIAIFVFFNNLDDLIYLYNGNTAVILTKLLVIKSVSEIRYLIF